MQKIKFLCYHTTESTSLSWFKQIEASEDNFVTNFRQKIESHTTEFDTASETSTIWHDRVNFIRKPDVLGRAGNREYSCVLSLIACNNIAINAM